MRRPGHAESRAVVTDFQMTVDSIAGTPTGSMDRPREDVVIEKIDIEQVDS